VPSPQLDAYGLGIRVPTWVISPFAKKSHLEPALYEHASTLKFLEAVFGLPTLASVNHQFDLSTPGGPNNEAANGQPTGPPAPPRDGLAAVGNLMECFEFLARPDRGVRRDHAPARAPARCARTRRKSRRCHDDRGRVLTVRTLRVGAGATHREHDFPARVLAFQDRRAWRLGPAAVGSRHRARGLLCQERGKLASPLAVVMDEHAVDGDVGIQQRLGVKFGDGDGLRPGRLAAACPVPLPARDRRPGRRWRPLARRSVRRPALRHRGWCRRWPVAPAVSPRLLCMAGAPDGMASIFR
jgi:phosphoesterase family protein